MASADLPYRDPTLPLGERVDDLLGRLSLDEKLAQLAGVWFTALTDANGFSAPAAENLMAHGTGHVTRIGGSTGLRPEGVAEVTNAIQRYLVERTRFGIPAIVHEEGVAGLCARDATQFPQAIGQAATWNPTLVEELAAVVREQMRAVGARQVLSPVMDVTRDPRWGRTEETYGENPYLSGRFACAYVRGIQTADLRGGVAATGKHFLGYGMSEGGLNHAPAHIGARELREVYAAPFQAAIAEAGLATVMNSYAEVDGLPCGGSAAILTDLLRGELGFAGCVVADYFTTKLLIGFHKIAGDDAEAARRALEAGLDVELPMRDCFGTPLRGQVERGGVAIEAVDRAVRRVLALKFALGLFENPYVDARLAVDVYGTSEQRALARRVATESIVLLQNRDGLLPLDTGIRRLAVLGPAADDIRLLQGDYSYPAHLEMLFGTRQLSSDEVDAGQKRAGTLAPGPYFPAMVTVAEGICQVVSDATDVRVVRGCEIRGKDDSGIDEAVEAARAADVAIVAIGGMSGLVAECTSGEFRDASDLGLTGLQRDLVAAVVATGTPTVVVLVGGRVFAVPDIAGQAPALLAAWVPGEEGGAAIADVIFGAANPGGRLPISMPRCVGQVPVYAGHKSGGGRSQMLGDYVDGPTAPLFAFGHGLSYTTFEYEDLTVPSDGTTTEPFNVAVSITNTGGFAGDEVVQLYIHDEVASVTRPVCQLAGFLRLALEPGETRRITFRVDPSMLAFYGEDMSRIVEPGAVTVMVGASSGDIRCRRTITLRGDVSEIQNAVTVPTEVRVTDPAAS